MIAVLHLPMAEVPEEPRREQELAVLAADATEVDDESVGMARRARRRSGAAG